LEDGKRKVCLKDTEYTHGNFLFEPPANWDYKKHKHFKNSALLNENSQPNDKEVQYEQ